jgi:hypothetical protein
MVPAILRLGMSLAPQEVHCNVRGEISMATGTPADKAKSGEVQGEGDYVAGRHYDQAQTDFARSGKVDEAARGAKPRDAAEASEMEQAEQEGKEHSKGEAPGDLKPGKKPRQDR